MPPHVTPILDGLEDHLHRELAVVSLAELREIGGLDLQILGERPVTGRLAAMAGRAVRAKGSLATDRRQAIPLGLSLCGLHTDRQRGDDPGRDDEQADDGASSNVLKHILTPSLPLRPIS